MQRERRREREKRSCGIEKEGKRKRSVEMKEGKDGRKEVVVGLRRKEKEKRANEGWKDRREREDRSCGMEKEGRRKKSEEMEEEKDEEKSSCGMEKEGRKRKEVKLRKEMTEERRRE